MRELLSYGGVTTKIRAMKKNLFSDEEFRELVSLKNMEEVYRFLADTDAYREALAPLAGSEIHREMIETAIDGALYKDFSKNIQFCRSGAGEVPQEVREALRDIDAEESAEPHRLRQRGTRGRAAA